MTHRATPSHVRTLAALACAAFVPLILTAAQADEASAVSIKSFAFAPGGVTVTAGTTVTWTNKDDEVHTVTSKDGKFHSAGLDTGDSFKFRFDVPGTYDYLCSLHPQMTGRITVLPRG